MPGPLQPPPRQIAWPVKFGLIFGQGQTQAACMFCLVSLVIVWFIALRPIQAELQFSRPTSALKAGLSYVGQVNANASQSAFRARSFSSQMSCTDLY